MADPTLVKKFWPGSDQPSMVCVWVWKISPKNVKFFPFGSKSTGSKAGQPLNYYGSKVC